MCCDILNQCSGNEALTGAEVPCALGIVLVLEHLEADAVTLTEGF